MPDWRFLRNVLLKALLLFVVFNLVFAAWPPVWLGRISAYNLLFPGRPRFPFGEAPSVSYNLSLYDLDAMFASHVLSAGTKPANEYRVLLVGDSSVWGTLLRPQDTLAGQLNAAGLATDHSVARGTRQDDRLVPHDRLEPLSPANAELLVHRHSRIRDR